MRIRSLTVVAESEGEALTSMSLKPKQKHGPKYRRPMKPQDVCTVSTTPQNPSRTRLNTRFSCHLPVTVVGHPVGNRIKPSACVRAGEGGGVLSVLGGKGGNRDGVCVCEREREKERKRERSFLKVTVTGLVAVTGYHGLSWSSIMMS